MAVAAMTRTALGVADYCSGAIIQFQLLHQQPMHRALPAFVFIDDGVSRSCRYSNLVFRPTHADTLCSMPHILPTQWAALFTAGYT